MNLGTGAHPATYMPPASAVVHHLYGWITNLQALPTWFKRPVEAQHCDCVCWVCWPIQRSNHTPRHQHQHQHQHQHKDSALGLWALCWIMGSQDCPARSSARRKTLWAMQCCCQPTTAGVALQPAVHTLRPVIYAMCDMCDMCCVLYMLEQALL
jgi:hypothetical protein